MKVFLKILCSILFVLLSSAVFSQTETGEVPGGDVSFFATFAGLVAGTVIITELIKRVLEVDESTPKPAIQALSWLMGTCLSVWGFWLDAGILGGLDWYFAILYGFGATLAANGVADTKLIQRLILKLTKK